MDRYSEVSFKPRGWSWIDPTKEIDAYLKAVRAGFDTVSNVISKTGDGRDMEDVLTEREQELKDMETAGIEFDTDPDRDQLGAPIGLTAEQTMQQSKDAADAKAQALKNNPPVPAAAAPAAAAGDKGKSEDMRGEDFIAGMTKLADAIRDNRPIVNLPQQAAPVVHVRAPEITVNPTPVNVVVDNKVEPTPITFRAPDVNVAAPNVTVENRIEPTSITVRAPDVKVEVAAPNVTVENQNQLPTPVVEFKPEIKVGIERIEVEQSEESEQHITYNGKGEIETIKTRRVK
jgi:hypothetical protein